MNPVVYVMLGWLLTAFILRIIFKRKDSIRIRDWARDNGYAVVSLQYHYLVLHALVRYLLGVVWLCPFPTSGAWYIKIQDEQGGQRQGYIHFGSMWVDIPGGEMKFEWQ